MRTPASHTAAQPFTLLRPDRSDSSDGSHSSSTGDRWGPVLATTAAPAVMHRLLGGRGTVRSRVLVNGMHLPTGALKYVEDVVLDAGSSCGEHYHATTEEIYFVTGGAGEMRVNGTRIALRRGDLVCVPLGSTHSVSAADRALAFLVAEVYPPAEVVHPVPAPTRLPMLTSLEPRRDLTRVLRARVDLGSYLTGPWDGFELVMIPPDVQWAEESPASDTVMVVVAGTLGGQVDGVYVAGGRGWCAGLPAHASWELTAGEDGCELVTVQVGGA